MKYAGMPMGMWALFSRSFEKALVNVNGYDGQKAKDTAVKAKRLYREIIDKLRNLKKGTVSR